MPITLHIKRVYEAPSKEDGFRVLVDRLWPRGLKKETAAIDEWAKDLAPSNELRKWFDHDPERWTVFQKSYKEELKDNQAVDAFVKTHGNKHRITLLYGAKNEECNQAVVLQQLLGARFKTV